MRVFIWHGYLLSGTGSNEYTRALARTLAGQGHEVTIFCQDPNPQIHDVGGARVVVPALPGPLPVFVLDHYENADAQLLTEMDREVVDEFVMANAEAIRAYGPADLLICNHLLLGGPVGAASGLPFVVKVHGSELEFAMRTRPDLCAWARETSESALAVVVGSEHIRSVVSDLVGIAADQIHEIPPGVDTEQMRPISQDQALSELLIECEADSDHQGAERNERLPDHGNRQRFEEFFASLGADERPVVYVGKLSQEKGVDLLLHAAKEAGLASIIVGFGPERSALEAIAGPRTLFTGPLQHRHLSRLWPLCMASTAPSVFPEAFGMVAAEAASCGCPPVVADHSGLAQIASGVREHYPSDMADLVSFPKGDVEALQDRLATIASLDSDDWLAISAGARAAVESLWSWDSVARRLLALVPQ